MSLQKIQGKDRIFKALAEVGLGDKHQSGLAWLLTTNSSYT